MEDRRAARLDLLGNAVLSLVRGATLGYGPAASIPNELRELITGLASVISRLADVPGPWPPGLVADAMAVAEKTTAATAPHRANRAPVVAAILYAAATDLEQLVEPAG